MGETNVASLTRKPQTMRQVHETASGSLAASAGTASAGTGCVTHCEQLTK